jgi:hypothetical protein
MESKPLYTIINFLVCFDMVRGKNGKSIFINPWRKVDDAPDSGWEKMAKYCRVEGGY